MNKISSVVKRLKKSAVAALAAVLTVGGVSLGMS